MKKIFELIKKLLGGGTSLEKAAQLQELQVEVKKEVEVVVETKVEPAVEAYVKQKIQEIDVEKATKAIETISIDLDILQMKWVSIYRQDSP